MSMLNEAPACAAAGKEQLLSKSGLPNLMNGLSAALRAWRSRRAVMSLRDFDNTQLADIGLQRRDVQAALDLPLSADPSHHLISARQNQLRGTKRF